MRTVTVSPRTAERLAELETSADEFRAIREQLQALARDPRKGYALPFQTSSKTLYRYDVGRFGFIYIFGHRTLEIVAVIPA